MGWRWWVPRNCTFDFVILLLGDFGFFFVCLHKGGFCITVEKVLLWPSAAGPTLLGVPKSLCFPVTALEAAEGQLVCAPASHLTVGLCLVLRARGTAVLSQHLVSESVRE